MKNEPGERLSAFRSPSGEELDKFGRMMHRGILDIVLSGL